MLGEQHGQHHGTDQQQSKNEIDETDTRYRWRFGTGSRRYTHHYPKRNDVEDSIKDSNDEQAPTKSKWHKAADSDNLSVNSNSQKALGNKQTQLFLSFLREMKRTTFKENW